MSAPRIIRSGERRLLGASLVLICLTAAAVNVPFAVTKVRSRTGTVQSRITDVRGAALAIEEPGIVLTGGPATRLVRGSKLSAGRSLASHTSRSSARPYKPPA